MDEKQPILARIIIEMLGAPKEHIEQVLRDYVEKLKESKTHTILKTDFAEAKEQGEMFSTFVELEISFKNLSDLLGFCFDSMPASVEVFSPETLPLSCRNFSDMLNDLQGKLHQIDVIAKQLRSENALLNRNSLELLRNFINHLIKEGKHGLSELSVLVGVREEELKPFLGRMVEEGILRIQEDQYLLENA